MTSRITLDEAAEESALRLVGTGHYASLDAVVQAGVRLLEERERQQAELADGLDRAIADAEAGRVFAASDVFEDLKVSYRARAKRVAED